MFGAERHLFDTRVQELGGRLARPCDERIGSLRRSIRRADVRVRLAEVLGDRVDHRVRDLGAAGAVEECERLAERREALTHRLDSCHDTCHSYLGVTVREAPTKQSRSAMTASSALCVARGCS